MRIKLVYPLPRRSPDHALGLAVLSPGESKSAEALLKEADDALYKAKEAGRNRIAVYESPPDGQETAYG